jgi:acetyl-CoA acetyltransferase
VSAQQVAIVGYGQSLIERHAPTTLGALTVDVAHAAIADAGLRPDQVDGFVTAPLMPALGDHSAGDGIGVVSSGWLSQHLGVYPRYSAGFEGAGQITGSIAHAAGVITSGTADYVLVHRALHNPQVAGRRYHGTQKREAHGMQQWTMPQGFFGPLATIALAYNEYLQRFGAKRESMATLVVEARKNGARIPWSYWRDRPLTVDEYLREPVINDPISRYDCDIPVDGVAAFVLTSAERARDLPHRPVYVAGCAVAQPPTRRLPMHWVLDDIYDAGAIIARRLWEQAGVQPTDVDLPQVYDGFAPLAYFWLETLGFCGIGDAHAFIQGGRIDSDEPGALPILSGGGALGNGRMHGVPQMLECYLQLSGRAGPRQRDGVSVGVACQASPHLGGVVAYSNAPR